MQRDLLHLLLSWRLCFPWGMSYVGDTQSLEGGLQVLVCIAGKGRAASSTMQLDGMQPAAILPSFCKLYLWILKEEL